jgi:hypothetical protein
LISGHAEITEALPPPHRNPQITDLRVRLSPTPAAIGEIVESFSAVLVLEPDVWEGRGSFVYGGNTIDDVPVRPEP